MLSQRPQGLQSPPCRDYVGDRTGELRVWAEAGTGCSPVADPARIAARTFASDMVAGMPIAAGRAAVTTTLAIETGGARLVTFGSVPAGFAGHTTAVSYSARLLALALATPRKGPGSWAGWSSASPLRLPATGCPCLPTATAQAIEASGAWLATILAPVAGIAGARAVHGVAPTVEALAIAIAPCAECVLTTLAAAALLLAGRRVAGTLVVAAAAPPACVAQAGSGLWIAP